MEEPGSITQLITRAQAGDELALSALWERYFHRLVGLARKKLNKQFVRDADGEDAALSAMASFWAGLQAEKFHDLKSRDNLWRLLVVITTRKAADYGTRSKAQKRGAGRVVGEAGIRGRHTIEEIVGNGPTPEFEAESQECLEQLLEQLDEDHREVAVMKLEGWKNREIAAERRCPLRRVERQLKAVRLTWSETAFNP